MKSFPFELTQLSLLFRPLFSKVVWPSVQLLLAGAILAVGTRTVTAVLHVMGHSEEQQFQKFHRILNRVKWSPLAASRRLLLALMEAFVPHGPLVMALDDTISDAKVPGLRPKVSIGIRSAPLTLISLKSAACDSYC
jgi:hypothetical protein